MPVRLRVECLESRNLPSNLPYGAIVSDSITEPGGAVDYTFSASAGDRFTLAMTSTPTSNGFAAYADLLAPSGTPADHFFATGQLPETAKETGTYTVHVHDYNLQQTGTFTLGLEGIKPISPNPTPLVPGGIVGGTIDAPIDVKQFTFTGHQGDDISLAMTSTPTTAGFAAYADVFGPSGNPVDHFFATGQLYIPLPESGTFMVQVHDYNYAQQGSFTLGLEGIHPISPNPTPLVPGGFVTGSTSTGIDVKQYTFQAHDGNILGLSLTSTPTQAGFAAYADLYAPSGNPVEHFFATGLLYFTAKETGTYMVQLHDYNYAAAGQFKIGLEGITPPSPDALSLPAGQTITGALTQTNDDAQYLFYGRANDQVKVTMTSTPDQANFAAYADVYAPSGNPVDHFFATGGEALPLSETGVYLIQVHDYNFGPSGHFTLRLDWGPPARSSIAGTVYNDRNANGVRNVGDFGLPGRVVYLDGNGNGRLDPGERSTTTDVQGNYAFDDLGAGTYLVREVLPAGWRGANPPGAALLVAVGAGQNAVGENFGNTLWTLATGAIGGRVFHDGNGNGKLDAGEKGLGGWRVYLDANNDGRFESNELSALTDANGNWSLGGLIAGKYRVRVVPAAGTHVTTPPGGVFAITLAAHQKVFAKYFGVR